MYWACRARRGRRDDRLCLGYTSGRQKSFYLGCCMNYTDEKDLHGQNEELETPSSAIAVEEESYKNQFLRLSADFANYRRRVEKERAELLQMGQGVIVKAFLPLIDDIERALAAARHVAGQNDSGHAGLASVVEGLSLVEKNMHKVLHEIGVQEVSCTGSFDPHHHEALMQVAADDAQSGTIMQVLSKGYTHRGAVMRHAKVSVAS